MRRKPIPIRRTRKDPLLAQMESLAKQRRHIEGLFVAYEKDMDNLAVEMNRESKRRWEKLI